MSLLPRVLILAGGFGTRLRTKVSDVPKPLAPIAGRPLLEYQVRYFKNQGFQKFTLLTGYLAEQIEAHFGDGERFGVEIDYSQEREPLGTGGAIRQAMEKTDENMFLVANGDSFFATDYRRFVRLASGPASLALKYSDDLSRYGAVEIDGDFKIAHFKEKSIEAAEGYLNAGVYVLRRELLEHFPLGKFSIESKVFQPLAARKLFFGIPCGGKFVDIGIPEAYEWAQSQIPAWLDEQFRPCLFLDRDGVLIRHIAYMHKPEDVVLVPEVIDLLKTARAKGWHAAVITNQSGVARGIFSVADCESVHAKIDVLLSAQNLQLDGYFSCYTHPEGSAKEYRRESLRRKPGPGMVLQACEQMPIDLSRSLMLGDNVSDQLALPDLKTILVQGDFPLHETRGGTVVTRDFAELRERALAYLQKN